MQKGQMKIVAGIIVLLLIIGIVIATQLFGKPKGEKTPEAVKKEEPQKTEKGFFDQLFGGAEKTAESPTAKQGTGFFDQLFGGGGGKTTAPSGQGGFFDKLFGSGSTETKTQPSQPSSGGGGFFDQLFGGSGSSAPSGSPETPLAPAISSGLPTGDLPVETRKVILSAKTNKIATCRYGSASGLSYESMQNVFSQTNALSHSTEVTGFNEGMAYKYYVKCIDQAGNKNTSDFIISFKILAAKDITPPIVRNPSHTGDVLSSNATSTVISVSTDEPADCRYSTAQGTSYGSMSKSFAHYDQTKRFHVTTITGLQNGKTYEFFARCKDSAGNISTGDVMISFSVR